MRPFHALAPLAAIAAIVLAVVPLVRPLRQGSHELDSAAPIACSHCQAEPAPNEPCLTNSYPAVAATVGVGSASYRERERPARHVRYQMPTAAHAPQSSGLPGSVGGSPTLPRLSVRLRVSPLGVRPDILPRGATAPVTVTLWSMPAGVTVYSSPLPGATVLARLPGNQPLRVATSSSDSPTWGRTLLWGSVPAWVPLASLRAYPTRYSSAPGVPPPVLPTPIADVAMALRARLSLRVPAYLRAAPGFAAAHLALLRSGVVLAADSWAVDEVGAAWYRVRGPSGSGWVYGDATTFLTSRPTVPKTLLAPFHGKGMWATYGLLQTSPVTAVVAAARAAGLTHLYVEVARSNRGFYGAAGLAALLPVAHRAGIRVIAWVYPFLRNLPADVATSAAAATLTAPTGDRPDGLIADVEQNMAEPAVRAYGQVLRAMLGANEPMAIATYPPQWAAGRTYPFATAALSWNVIVPMDYWHLYHRAYSPAEVYNFVSQGVRSIRAATRSDEPVEVLGQMFDARQSGVNSPVAAEVSAAAAAARDSHALGVSYFEWNHATPEEWDALTRLPAMGSR